MAVSTSNVIALPDRISSEEELDEIMSRPRAELIEAVRGLSSPLLLLGGAGKMGPSLALLARRAAEQSNPKLRVVVASRFSDAKARQWLETRGVETLTCDLLERDSVKQLPEAENVIYLVGLKFGTTQNPSLTWATNTLAPAHVAERFPRSRIVALSTGNVYPLSRPERGGSVESDLLMPLGEYPNAAVARERIFEYHSRKHATPVVLLRLNYAVDLRYGVLLEIARKVWAGQPVDVTTGHVNCIWQGDANEAIVRTVALAASPPSVFNMTGSETLPVREIAQKFSELMGRPAKIVGAEAETALLSNSRKLWSVLGEPPTPVEHVVKWTAHWVMENKMTLGKPTHFEVRDGKF